ncbi:MAG: CAP domain-containing protein [Rhodobacterales bacterium]|nr:CAP domain-containing protein [Rhodobacterales bacterium]
MLRREVLLSLGAVLVLSACADTMGGATLGPDGKPLPQVYKIRESDVGRIQLRMTDSVNALRQARGLTPLALNAELNAAAATHSRDMSVQNRPWHFGSDGSSPIQRAQRVGYPGTLLGELISETYETELETLAAWMANPDTRAIVLQPEARNMGFALYQEKSGKIWWTMLTGN